jgi:hypothetical protein
VAIGYGLAAVDSLPMRLRAQTIGPLALYPAGAGPLGERAAWLVSSRLPRAELLTA